MTITPKDLSISPPRLIRATLIPAAYCYSSSSPYFSPCPPCPP